MTQDHRDAKKPPPCFCIDAKLILKDCPAACQAAIWSGATTPCGAILGIDPPAQPNDKTKPLRYADLTPATIAQMLHDLHSGMSANAVARRHNLNTQLPFHTTKKHTGLSITELRKLTPDELKTITETIHPNGHNQDHPTPHT